MSNIKLLYQIESLINKSKRELPTSTWIELQEYIEVLITIEKEY
jgi:hypothetical protein